MSVYNFATSVLAGSSAQGGGVEGQSLRFNDDDTAYLEWTPTSAGNRKTWTWSAWVKRGNIEAQTMFSVLNGSNDFILSFDSNHRLVFSQFQSGVATYFRRISTQVFRDPSAWYHIVAEVDTTQATATDRVKLYVNGVQITQFDDETNPSINYDTSVNTTNQHNLGRKRDATDYCDCYLAEVNFVDGTAYDASSFGETDANGQWVPIIAPSVTYGTNGFYLPFTNDYEVEGFNTVTYQGNGGTQYIGGVGFEPDLVWIKVRNATNSHYLFDTVRGADLALFSDSTTAETDYTSTGRMTSFDTDGFSVKYSSSTGTNASGNTYVAWAWDAGTGSAVSNTDGDITTTVKNSSEYGFSIITYTGTGTAETIGHGLGAPADLMIFKNRSNGPKGWPVFVNGVTGDGEKLVLNSDEANNSGTVEFADVQNTSTTFKVGNGSWVNESGANMICYAWKSVAGYSDIGSYTGNGSTSGPTVTTGFKPAFVMIKRTDSTGDWHILDNTRSPYGELDNYLYPSTSAAEYAGANDGILITDTTFQLSNSYSALNASGGTYIYMAFADKREAAFWLDQSGNNNDWTNNNMQESDISLDSPTNNFATLNPLSSSATLSEGNLRSQYSGSGTYQSAASTMSISSGKWYVELRVTVSANYPGFGIADITTSVASDPNYTSYLGLTSNGIAYYVNNGFFTNNAIDQSSTVTISSGDIIGIAIDLDSAQNTYKIYQNGTLAETYDINAPANAYAFCESTLGTASAARADWNFGQDSSFHGLEVAQGNTDGNGKGDFYYEPPAGYLALCTDNLPDPEIADPSEHFNTVLWSGTGGSRSITGVGFEPDLVWLKTRSGNSDNHRWWDTVRGYGATKDLYSNSTQAESSSNSGQYGYVSTNTTDGFDIADGTDATYEDALNYSGWTYVAWNWKADNTSGASNTDGTITSTVSANTTAGFSIVTYTGTGASGTIGHGLASAPEMIIAKNRTDGVAAWLVYHASNTSAPETDYLRLNATDATVDNANIWNDTAPTRSVYSVGPSGTHNGSGDNIVSYCFHSVEGYSKFDSYTGNGSADGPFVYTGFRPAFVIIKRTSNTGSWYIHDSKREGYNGDNDRLQADQTDQEFSQDNVDILSNGFKLISNSSFFNGSGNTFIYMAFAESPFKYSNAR